MSIFCAREWLQKAALICGGIAASFLILEVVLRVGGLATPNYTVTTATGLVVRKPKSVLRHTLENRNTARFNNWGFHDLDREPDGASYRVLAIGDSFVEGLQVPRDSLFTLRIERNLKQEGYPVEVINAGTSGTGTAYQYLLWKEFFADKGIDQVVLFIFLANDLEDNHINLGAAPMSNAAYLDADGEVFLNSRTYPLLQRLVKMAASHSAVVNEVYTSLYRLKRSLEEKRRETVRPEVAPPKVEETPELAGHAVSEDAEWQAAIVGTLKLIRRWNRELQEEGKLFGAVALGLGGGHRLNDYKYAFLDSLKTASHEGNFPFLEFDPAGYRPVDVYSFDGRTIGHLNYLGHALMSEAVSEWLKESIQLEAH